MNEVIKTILARRSIRKYNEKTISDADLNIILNAGLWAPNAGGRQNVHMVIMRDRELTEKLGRINRSLFGKATNNHDVNPSQISIAEDDSIKSGFYGAPVVIALYNMPYAWCDLDVGVVAQNMLLAAQSLGISSLMLTRAEETMNSELGQQVAAKTGIPENYRARCFVLLGYTDSDPGTGRPRKESRIHFLPEE